MKNRSGKEGEVFANLPFTAGLRWGLRLAGLHEPIGVWSEADWKRVNSLCRPLYYLTADMFMHACK